MTTRKAIDRVEFLKKINTYKEKGMSVVDVVNVGQAITNNAWQNINNTFKNIDLNMAQIKIVDNLTKNAINDAIVKFRNNTPLFKMIEGVTNELPIKYFIHLHLTDSDKCFRRNLNNRLNKEYKKNHKTKPAMRLEPKKEIIPEPIIEPTPEPIPEPVKELWDFSDENEIEIKRPVLVQFHGKSSGLGYGCAANMCAEK